MIVMVLNKGLICYIHYDIIENRKMLCYSLYPDKKR